MAVTATIQCADEKTAAPLPAAVDYRSAYSHWLAGIDAGGTGQVTERYAGSVERPSAIAIVIDSRAASTVRVQQEPSALLMSQCHGSAGIVSGSSDYGPLLPHVGSSSLIVDRRSVQRWPWIDAGLTADGFESIPVVDQLKELRAALSLNKSQLARIMCVTRPTIYEWYEGKDPNAVNCERIRTLLRVLKFKPGIECAGVEPLGTNEIILAHIEPYQRFDSDWVSFDDETSTTPMTVDVAS